MLEKQDYRRLPCINGEDKQEPKEWRFQVKFDENASQYDGQRKKRIPCFDDFYSIAISLTRIL
ncbi:hypothetical protein [Desulfosporosinus acidiphilus]|uniref:hypothetical protein n=1 Tax=Desulfosporosinus acidiphilus TaxID=885581 RepID=UPI000673D648|nr:hypothetical protein [Desulfosporosinus acidiphilus]